MTIENNKKVVNIIITCSLQNDFIEKLDDIKIKYPEGDVKASFADCQDLWLDFFTKGEGKVGEDASFNRFIQWCNETMPSRITGPRDVSYCYCKIMEKYKHRVHVEEDECNRLWNEAGLEQSLRDLISKATTASENEKYYYIHLRDWHDQTDPSERGELDFFGFHCIKGTYGAEFVYPLNQLLKDKATEEYNIVLNSNSLSSFSDSNLEDVLNNILKNTGSSKTEVRIGTFGMITNVKLLFLMFELMVVHKYKNVFLCEDFSAGFNKLGHQSGLDYMRNVLNAQIVNKQLFREIFKF